MMAVIKSWRHETGVSDKARYNAHLDEKDYGWVSSAMGRTEIILTIIILMLIIFGFWFIFSGEIWLVAEYIENSIYPTFDAL
ncbi:Ecr family regulatory small membrane protein [Enterobacter cloacae subsp. cloacae]